MIYAGVLKPFVGAISVGFLISLIIVIWLMWRYRKWGKDRFLTESLVMLVVPRFYVSTSKSIIKALINMHSFEIQLSPIG